MTNALTRQPQGGSQSATTNPSSVVQIHLEEVGRHSWKDALSSAVVGAGGGPLYDCGGRPQRRSTDADMPRSERSSRSCHYGT